MGKTIVVNLAGTPRREQVLADLIRLFPRKPKELTDEQRTWLVALAKRGWNDFEIDLALDECGLTGGVDLLRGYLGMTPANPAALYVSIAGRRLSIIDQWIRVVDGKLKPSALVQAAAKQFDLRRALGGIVGAVGQVDAAKHATSVEHAVAILGKHDARGAVTAAIAAKLGKNADFVEAKVLVLALARAGKLAAKHDELLANGLFGAEAVDELRALISALPANRREKILLAAVPAGYPFGKPKPEGAWLYYDLELSPAIRRRIEKLIATTRKEELPAKRAKELQALFAAPKKQRGRK